MLLTLRDISVRFTEEPVLDEVNLIIEEGERICLVGRNGAGKSTLLNVLGKQLTPDSGEIEHADTLKVARLRQDIPRHLNKTVQELVMEGLGEVGGRLLAYERAAAGGADAATLLERQHALEADGAWEARVGVEAMLSRMELTPEAAFESLSGGTKRRGLLARALAPGSDLLLLDEHTNHLDIQGIQWLENFLRNTACTLVFITHDRAFLDNVATRIVEVDRGRLYSFPGRFEEYRRRKAEALAAEASARREFDKQLAEEEEWLSRGVKARAKRNMGRVRGVEAMREIAADRRGYHRRAQIRAQFGEPTGKRVIETRHVDAKVNGEALLRDFSLNIRRGQTLGVMGPNGCGKTTLLRLLLGRIQPDAGRIIFGENLQIAYFDQAREQLNFERDAAWNVGDGADRVDFEGKSLHVLGYLRAFLFDPERARTPVRMLSGGERNRLLLARLFARPSNVLVLDEPTNDLDMETLELLENLISDFPGTAILVSHDRAFVNHVADAMLMHEGEDGFRHYVGNYDDWLRQRRPQKPRTAKAGKPASDSGRRQPRPAKLGYKQQRELASLPERIEALEARIQGYYDAMAGPDLFQRPTDDIKAAQDELGALENELAAAYARWETLEAGNG